MLILISTAALAAGFFLDLLIGDPHGWPHLVRGFGSLIAALEKLFYPMRNKHLGGALLTVCTLLACTGLPAAALWGAWQLSPWAYFVFESLLCWQLLAIRSLRDESRAVYKALTQGDLSGARKAVSMIVGRDTASLDEVGITRAAVETVAENTADGVAAPLLYMMLGGAALGCFCKAVNTMDSMIGYRNERYLYFGRFAAKLDDVVNYIPARLCALAMTAAAWLTKLNAKSAYRVWRRDRRNHLSPNSAQTEAVMAGALDVRLAGDAWYFGTLHKKPTIGDDIHPIVPEDIRRAHRLLYATAVLLLLLALIFRGCIYAAI